MIDIVGMKIYICGKADTIICLYNKRMLCVGRADNTQKWGLREFDTREAEDLELIPWPHT